MTVVDALYLYLLAILAGYVLIGRVPSMLHTPLLSGSNFMHGIVLIGAVYALWRADNIPEHVIGFLAVAAATANVVGGFIITERLLSLISRPSTREAQKSTLSANADHGLVASDRHEPDER